MRDAGSTSIHASAVQVGNRGVLIRGPSGSGKSSLAFDLILAGRSGQIAPAKLVGDDRVHLHKTDGGLIVRPAPALAGLIEIRGLGIQNCDSINEAAVGLVVDLHAEDAERLPPAKALRTRVLGIEIPRIPVGRGFAGLPLVIASLTMTANSSSTPPSADCSKGIGNHITRTIATE
jgi:serine kinase of HPr protein (carbohydrate metabolism regulator)